MKIAIIAPSRPIADFKKDFFNAVQILKSNDFELVLAPNLEKKYRNSAGTKEKRAEIINSYLSREDINILWCAVGGDSCEEILDRIDYKNIRDNNKFIIGSSDNTHLILSLFLKSRVKTVFGPNLVHFASLSTEPQESIISLLNGHKIQKYPQEIKILKKGKAVGKLFGGNLFALNNVVQKNPSYKFDDTILFWEDIEDSVTDIKNEIRRLKKSSLIKSIKGMVIGGVKSDQDPIQLFDMVVNEFKNYNFPIIKVDFFGHYTKEFYPLPIGRHAVIDTSTNRFALES